MNIKSIIFGSLAVGLAIGGTLFNSFSGNEGKYIPRTINNGGLKGQAGYAAYLHSLKVDPATGEIDYNYVEQIKNQIKAISKKNNKALIGLNWTQMGPDNVGGRCRAVLVDRNDPNTLYAGSVAGGLFVSYNAAQTWQPVTGMEGLLGENLAVSCLTQTDNGRIFFGTGSSFETLSGNGGSGFIGNGVYEYVPSTGQVLPIITNATALPNNNFGSQWSYCNAIASKGNRLYIGTKQGMYWADPDVSGLYPTLLSGWTNPIINPITSNPENGNIHDIDIASDGSMMVCLGARIYTSDQSDVTFTQELVSGGRISGAIAPSNPNVFYRLRSSGILVSLDISIDKGQNWDVIVPGGGGNNYCLDPFRQNTCATQNSQGGYDDAIAVDPNDWGHILVGGVQLFEWQYNPGSNPIGGSWFKSANLYDNSANPYYVHADKHTIVWPTTGTIYIGCDGGIFKSVDNGGTWSEKNLGFNVTTFYDMTVNSFGWMMGGAQDNGTQLFAPGVFSTPSPLGTFEVSGGDGFDCCFSGQGPGIAYTTSQEGVVMRSAGGTPGIFVPTGINSSSFHTVISNWERNDDPLSVDSVTVVIDSNNLNGIVTINPFDPSKPRPLSVFPGDTLNTGDTINYESLSNGTPLQHVYSGSQVVFPTGSSYEIKLQDPIQNKFVFRANDGVYLTRDAARLNDLTPEWFRISNFSSAENFEFSPDGNHLFIGTSNGQCWRISGLSLANDSTLNYDDPFSIITATQISGVSGGGYVGIAVDPNDGNNIIITTTGYSSSNHIYRCSNALSGAPTAEAIHGAFNTLPKMPIYDACIDMNNNNRVILGTEWGVWTSDNAFSATAPNVDWTDESGSGMCHVPIFAVEQQTSFNSPTTGYIYLGTHGRGFYMSPDLFTSIEENNDFVDFEEKGFASDLNVYPNPINRSGVIEFDLHKNTNAKVNIYNLSGALVKTINLGNKAKGNHKVRFNASSLSIGTYILSLESDTDRKVAKFIVNR